MGHGLSNLSTIHVSTVFCTRMSKWEFVRFRQGASAQFSPREFFDLAVKRILGNVNAPAFPGRKPIDSVADTFALGSTHSPEPLPKLDDRLLGILQAPIVNWIVTDEVIHKASLSAVECCSGFLDQCILEYSRRRPSWLRRNFTNPDAWLFSPKTELPGKRVSLGEIERHPAREEILLSLEADEVLSEYVSIHDSLFRASFRKIVPIPGIFLAVDYDLQNKRLGRLHSRLRSVLDKTTEIAASAALLLPRMPS